MAETNKYEASIKQSSEDEFEKPLNDLSIKYNKKSKNGITRYQFDLTIEQMFVMMMKHTSLNNN